MEKKVHAANGEQLRHPQNKNDESCGRFALNHAILCSSMVDDRNNMQPSECPLPEVATSLDLSYVKETVSKQMQEMQIRSNPPANMSVKEAALFVGVSERTLRETIANHEIRHVRFGSRIILRRVDLDAFLEEKVCA